jgi:hypothetical protein
MTDGPIWERPSELAEQCARLYGLACPPLWGPPRRPYFKTYGPQVCRVMQALGYPPMPWQRYLFDVALEVDPDTGLFWYREVDLSVMRQQGKTEAVGKALPVWRMTAWPDQGVMYSAQTRNDARDKLLKSFWPTVEARAGALRTGRPQRGREDWAARGWGLSKQLGSEEISFAHPDGEVSRWRIMANKEESGHGGTLDLGLIDEAFAHKDSRNEQGMSPAMLTRAMAQLWVLSAAGTEESFYWNAKRAAGRESIERLWRSGQAEWPRTCYMEWYPREGMARDDPATWWDCMPALGHTITEATVKAELERWRNDLPEFDRGMLNRTAKRIPPPDPNVPVSEFEALIDHSSRLGDRFALAIDIPPDRQGNASICAYGPRVGDGMGHGELIDYRPGVRWLIPRLLTLRDRYSPIAVGIDDRGAASALIPELERHGLTRPRDPKKPRRGDLVVTNSKDMVAACGQLADEIRAAGLRHRGQAQVMAAIRGARTRMLEGAWAWDRRSALDDITPLVGITLARYAWRAREHLYQGGSNESVW